MEEQRVIRAVEGQDSPEDQFIGYGAVAEYAGVKRNTMSSYVARSIGPEKDSEHVEGQYVLPVFTRATLDAWLASRPGQGARTDLGDRSEVQATTQAA